MADRLYHDAGSIAEIPGYPRQIRCIRFIWWWGGYDYVTQCNRFSSIPVSRSEEAVPSYQGWRSSWKWGILNIYLKN